MNIEIRKIASKTHPWAVDVDGGEVAQCISRRAAQIIADLLKEDMQHHRFQRARELMPFPEEEAT